MFRLAKPQLPLAATQPVRVVPQTEKAGCIIFGWDKDDKGISHLYMLSSYSEGRFEPGIKAPHIPKGGVNLHRGEMAEEGAYRETREETGFNVKRLERGGYRGLKIASRYPDIQTNYTSSSGHEKRVLYKVIKLEEGCIRRLGKNKDLPLKGQPENNSASSRVRLDAGKMACKVGLPALPEMIEVFRTGELPKIGKRAARVALRTPALPDIAARYGLGERPSAAEWIAFNEGLAREDKKALQADYKKVKKKLQSRYLGDKRGLKFDDSDCPGRIFQEGGAVLPVEEFIRRAITLSHANPLYAKSAWGHDLENGQLDALVKFFTTIDPMAVYAATTDLGCEHARQNHVDLEAKTVAPPIEMPEWLANAPLHAPDFANRAQSRAHLQQVEALAARAQAKLTAPQTLITDREHQALKAHEALIEAQTIAEMDTPVSKLAAKIRGHAVQTIDGDTWRRTVESRLTPAPPPVTGQNRG